MGKIVTLKTRVNRIKRQYKHVTPFRFLYNKKSELRITYKRVRVWFLIHDDAKGYSIFITTFAFVEVNKTGFTVEKWRGLFKNRLGKYDSIYTSITQIILPAINSRSGADWKFKAVLAWVGLNDIRSNNNTRSSKHRNKTPKKRLSNASHTNRNRY